MSSEVPDPTGSRPVLIIISESSAVPSNVRSGGRQVRRWHADSGHGTGETGFAGDPTDPGTYAWARDAVAVTAVIDLQPVSRARAALAALRECRPDAAVLLLSAEASDLDGPGDGTLARGGRMRDVLRLDLEEELERLEAERRTWCLRRFAEGGEIVPILIHNDPDPDAVSSALAVATLLGGSPDRTPIVTMDGMTRPENRRMADLLHIRVTRVTLAELRQFDRVITVDTQPRGLQKDGSPRVAVLDHHPREPGYDAEFADIRPDYGATASIMTEYLRAAQADRIHRPLATALLFGIRTDTDSLMRGVTPADVEAYAFLQQHADLQLVRRFERPSYPLSTAIRFGRALAGAACEDDLCVAYLGTLDSDEAHVLADLADFCLGVENVTWVAAAAVLDDELVITLRHTGAGAGAGGESRVGAGSVARALAEEGGSGGGHAMMARAALPLERARAQLAEDDVAAAVWKTVRSAIEAAGSAATRPG